MNSTPKKQSVLLITRPEHDPGTRYLSCWSKKIIEIAEKKGVQVLDLQREKACKKEFEGRIKKVKPSFIFLNGHGDENSVTGHNNEILVKCGKNEQILKGRVTYAVSCDSAQNLGKACDVEDTAYIGYKRNFVFTLNRKYLARPLKDIRAARFLKASNQVGISLLKGHSVKEASERSKNMFRDTIRSLLTSKYAHDPDIIADVKDLWWNMQHQVCLGDQQKKI